MFDQLNAYPDSLAEEFNASTTITNLGQHIDALNLSTLPNIVNMIDNRAYIVNGLPYADLIHFKNIHERSHDWILTKIENMRFPDPSGKLHIGAGGIVNFSYMSAAKSSGGILCDINPLQKPMWDKIISLLALSPSPRDFLNGIRDTEVDIYDQVYTAHQTINFSNTQSIAYEFDKCGPLTPTGRREKDYIFRRKGGISEWLDDPCSHDHYWLKKGYDHIHNLARDGQLVALTLDLLDTNSCQELSDHLRKYNAGREIGTMYISSIADFLSIGKEWTGRDNPEFKHMILENLDIINPAKGALIIDSRQFWPQSKKMEITINNGFYPML